MGRPLTAIAVLIAGVSCSAAAQPAGSAAPPAMSPADQAMMSGMSTMQHDMDGGAMTGDADRDFVAMMIPHHRGAVDMAKAELRYGKDPAMRTLARAIIRAQDRELAQMRAWQRAHR